MRHKQRNRLTTSLAAATAVAVAAVMFAVATPVASAAVRTVQIPAGKDLFTPQNLGNVTVGDTITFKNNNAHNVVSTKVPAGAATFASPIMSGAAATFSVKVTVPGNYRYYCSLHASTTEANAATQRASAMVGQFTVVAAGPAPAPAPAPPTVMSKSPLANATRVAQAGNMAARFSENVSGVNSTTFTLRKTSTRAAVRATVRYSGTTHLAILNPTAMLAPGTRYTATLSSRIKDADLNPITTTNWSFTTGPRPRVTRRSPAANLLRVSRMANVAARFSENVAGVSRTRFILKKSSTGKRVTVVVSYNRRTRVATMNPRLALAANTRYTATLSTLIHDADGNRIPATSWRFTTRR